jgi:Mrp family chromosome partitioning ATPase/capsular polysaccharide biosynthesis protein
MASESAQGLAVRDYLGVIARRKWLIIGLTIACAIAGVAYLITATPQYLATAKMLYVQPVAITNPLVQGGVFQALQQPDMDAISATVASSQVGDAAGDIIGDNDPAPVMSVTAVALTTSPSTDSTGTTKPSVVGIEVVSSDPKKAAKTANAFAQAFVDYRRDSARAQVRGALAAVEAAMKSYTSESSKTSAEYLQLLQSRQALELQLESLTGDFTVISPATPPPAPFSPRKVRTLALAIILGLALGCALAFLLEQLDTRVRDERQVTDYLGLPVLAHLPPLGRRPVDGGALQMLVNPAGPMAEAVRVLRGNLSFTGVDGDVRSILITSSVRSEGKSVTACNLAVSMALAGQRVVLVDGDFRRPRVHAYMRLTNGVGLSSVLARRASLDDAVIQVPLQASVSTRGELGADRKSRVMSASGDQVMSYMTRPGSVPKSDSGPSLRVLPSGPLPPNPGEMAASQRLSEIVATLAESADLVIIDSPPLLEVGDTAAMAGCGDGVVFVSNLARVRWPMLEQSFDQLAQFPSRKLGLVLIAAKSAHKHRYYGYEQRSASGSAGDSPLATR